MAIVNFKNVVLQRKIAMTQDDTVRHLFIKVVGYMFTSVKIVEKLA